MAADDHSLSRLPSVHCLSHRNSRSLPPFSRKCPSRPRTDRPGNVLLSPRSHEHPHPGAIRRHHSFFYGSDLYCYLARYKALTGLLFAFAVTLKISPLAFLFFFFLMKREWKILWSAAAGFILFFFFIPSAAIGLDTNWTLLKTWRELMSASQSDTAYRHYLWGELFTPFATHRQSLYAVLTRLAWPSEAAFIGRSNAPIRVLSSTIGVVLLALPFTKMRPDTITPPPDPLRLLAEFSFFPMVMLFASPVTQVLHYTVIYFLFLAALMLTERVREGSWTRKYLEISLWICALSLTLGMIFTWAGDRGLPLWGAMFLWIAVLCATGSKHAEL